MAGGIDFLAGPDTYRRLPEMIANAGQGIRGADFGFSSDETYCGIEPARSGTISAFIPVMRGCNNRCAFCVVPFTRGKERSRPLLSVLEDVGRLAASGYKEITLLGQNVNSYSDDEAACDFSELLDRVALAAEGVRIRFTTSHPKDISESLVRVIAARNNICNAIHLPVQSGSTRMLKLMNRGHTREEYIEKIAMIRGAIPGVTVSTDLIAGFCGETLEDYQATLSMMEEVRFDFAYMFYYSVRPGTYAAKHLPDDVPEEEKKRRLEEIIALQGSISGERNAAEVGSVVEVLAESESKRSSEMLMGRTDTNRVVVFDRHGFEVGDMVKVRIRSSTPATLIGSPV
ncbi:MAG: MiaB/RimO family radical SAM methylthiotransferase, partial [Ignavibacteriaceae bacterium]|nr:MiaB/RimO family radical SAM methylthiotransferase [Ignavibacteriaceae bacterium]